MRIFSLPNLLLIAMFMLANGHVMDHIPAPLRALMGKGTAIAMSDKFDMNKMLLELHKMQQQAPVYAQQANYQPYDFGSRGNGLVIQQKPFPTAELQAAINANIAPGMQAEINSMVTQVLGEIAATAAM